MIIDDFKSTELLFLAAECLEHAESLRREQISLAEISNEAGSRTPIEKTADHIARVLVSQHPDKILVLNDRIEQLLSEVDAALDMQREERLELDGNFRLEEANAAVEGPYYRAVVRLVEDEILRTGRAMRQLKEARAIVASIRY